MTTPEVERRLADLLRERAEGAMERTDMHEELSSLLTDSERDLHRRRRWGVAAAAVAAASAVVLAAWLGRGDADRADPPVAPADPDAAVIATSFLEANYAHDLDRAAGMLAPDAVLVDSNVREWRSFAAWTEAAGFSLAEHSCQPVNTTTVGTEVRCEFELHGLGSEQLGRGPYGGNTYDLTIRDGEIVRAEEVNPYNENGFSDEMWEPFSLWIVAEHPEDVRVMYDDYTRTGARSTPRSLQLWEQRVAEYVDSHR